MAKWDILFGFILAGLGATMIIVARGFPAIIGLSVGPSLFPILIGAGMTVIGCILAFNAWRTRPQAATGSDMPETASDPFFTWNLALISALILAFLAMVDVTGFSIACFAIIFALLRVYHRGRLMRDLILTVVSVLAIFIIFSTVFRVSLPVGPVELLIFKVIG